MKHQAQPAINNYFTIHVPPASMLQQHKQKKVKQPFQMANPFMNKKLQQMQMKEKKQIACLYKHGSLKSIKSKRKMQPIPLLKNLNTKNKKIGILKEADKNFYNIIFTKKSLVQQPESPRKTANHTQRKVSAHFSRKTFRDTSQQNFRRTTSNMTHNLNSSPMKIDSVQWGINLGKSQELQISGFKAPTSEMVDHLKKMSIDESNGLYYRNIYQEN